MKDLPTGENKMGVAPVLPLIFKMSLPAMFSMLIQALYNVVDSIFVSYVAKEALTAVSLAFPVQNLMIAVAVGTGVGINSVIARRLGEKRQEEADRAAAHGVVFALISALAFALIGFFFSRPFLAAFSDTPAVVDYGAQYLTVITVFGGFAFVQVSMEKILQATGDMLIPMISHLVGACSNIILDPIMIFGLLGFPAMGVAGAAIATVTGQAFGMTTCLLFILLKEHKVKVSLRHFRFRPQTVKDIYSVGVPSIIMQSIASVMSSGMYAILGGFSETAMTVFGVYFKLQSFVFMPVFGLNQGVMPIMGYNYGARNKKRLMAALRYGVTIAFCLMTVGMLVFMIFPQVLLSFFNADAEMYRMGVPALRYISLSFPLAAVGILLSTLFQALGFGSRSMMISLMRQLIFILPLAFIFARLGVDFVWLAFPVAECFATAVSFYFFRQIYKTRIEPLDRPADM